ncbi:Fatty-acid-binding protein 1 [Platanthera guangdongensis]|uniref:Fatty-acid-binding protein 1 n=1 Tax=Platanthera guangdongensis TaxID=2320717 RepID=A0ABR2MC77_9ASPA
MGLMGEKTTWRAWVEVASRVEIAYSNSNVHFHGIIAVDGKEVGSIQSKHLCQSVLDLYIGDDPFDKKAKEDVELGLASLLQN